MAIRELDLDSLRKLLKYIKNFMEFIFQNGCTPQEYQAFLEKVNFSDKPVFELSYENFKIVFLKSLEDFKVDIEESIRKKCHEDTNLSRENSDGFVIV
jgi:hypothetical protein